MLFCLPGLEQSVFEVVDQNKDFRLAGRQAHVLARDPEGETRHLAPEKSDFQVGDDLIMGLSLTAVTTVTWKLSVVTRQTGECLVQQLREGDKGNPQVVGGRCIFALGAIEMREMQQDRRSGMC